MFRIVLAAALVFSSALTPYAAEPQQTGKVYRLGALREGPESSVSVSVSFKEAMRRLGWVEGRNLTIERRQADRRDELPALASELVRLKVDLIFTIGTPATIAAKQATTTIPIVFNLADDPVTTGLVVSFARPGGNLTGFAQGVYDQKLLEVLKEAVPKASRIAYFTGEELRRRTDRLHDAAQVLGVQVLPIIVHEPGDFETSLTTAVKRQGVNAVLVPNVAWFGAHLDRIAAATIKNRLPAIGYQRRFAESGGLLSYAPPLEQSVPRIVTQIDKILRGAKPAGIPVEQPTKFELVVNLKTAKAFGLTIPQTTLLQADQTIE
jgi:putative tryptophan/tyrosine transport system substrate-binding protein